MNINILNQGRDFQNDNLYGVGSASASSRMTVGTPEYSLDISGRDKDINAFGISDLTTFEDVKEKAALKDVSLESNALAVMSNCLSSEDFAKLQKDGFSPEDMTPEQTVTNLDKIKASLVESGVLVPGFTDDLSSEEIEKIAGSKAAAAAIESALKENLLPVSESNVKAVDSAVNEADKVTVLTDDAKKYMINNGMEPTVNNIYMANHSSSDANAGSKAGYYKDATGYVGKNPTDVCIDELTPQIEKILKDCDIPVNENTLKDAKWLIEKDIPLTKENMESLNDINSVNVPLDKEDVAKAAAAAIADGVDVSHANLTNTESMAVKAGKFVLKMSESLEKKAASNVISKSQLEEIRLMLTVEAGISLMKKGITLDTSDLMKVVSELKQAERDAFQPLLMNDEYDRLNADDVKSYDDELSLKIDLFKETQRAIKEIKSAPVEALNTIIYPDEDLADTEAVRSDKEAEQASDNVTLKDFAKTSNALRAEYEKAGKSYETMMSKPRADMGDSIRKAFRNVDDILDDLDIEVTRLNEKAVRILGYSSMEINEANIEKALKAEVAVDNLISNMTPAKVLKMIRDGENPLDSDIYELSKKVMEESDDESADKYSRFLYNLEKNGEISENEKSAFIGMFRLFHRIEKSDGKLVGDVLKADEKLTLQNLLTASRSQRQMGSDVKIDDSFGTLEKLVTCGESITDQILAGFENKETYKEYAKEEAANVKEMVSKEASVILALENFDEPQSPINMAAMDSLINSRGSFFKGLNDKLDDNEKQELSEEMNALADSLNDEESAAEGFSRFSEKAEEIIKNKSENADKYIDVKGLKLLNRQLNIVSKMARERTYEVPVTINGELTSINLKIISDSENAGKVDVSFDTELTGEVNAQFTLRGGEVSGFIVTKNSYFESVIKEKEQSLKDELVSAGANVTSMYYTSSKSMSIKGNYTDKTENETVASSRLYSVAKAVIKAIQK